MAHTHNIGFRASHEMFTTLCEIARNEHKASLSAYLRRLVMNDIGRRRLPKKRLQKTLPRSINAANHRRLIPN